MSALYAPVSLPPRLPLPTSANPLAALFCVLLQKSERHPLLFQSLAHSLQKRPECHLERSSFLPLVTSRFSSPLESALTDEHPVLAEIGRSRPSASPLESTLARSTPVTSLESALTNKGEGGGPVCSVYPTFRMRIVTATSSARRAIISPPRCPSIPPLWRSR